jgi:Kef-type K+ transport system membrane component KefB
MTGLTLLLLAAALAYGLSRATRLPVIPLLLIAGFGLQLLAEWGEVEITGEALRHVIELGLAFLVFAAGIDLSPERLKGRERAIFHVGFWQFFVLGWIGIAVALALGYPLIPALYLGCALSASSTLVVIRQLQQRQCRFEPFGRLVVGVLLLQDVLIVFFLVVLARAAEGWLPTFIDLGYLSLLVVAAAILHFRIVPWVVRQLHLDDEERLLFALTMLFLFIIMAEKTGLPYIVGGFLAGFALSAFPMNGLIRGMVDSLNSFFVALFFIGIGFLCTFPPAIYFAHAALFVVVLIVVTIVLVTFIAERMGFSTKASIESGVLLSQTSEFSLMVMLAGVASGQISQEVFSMFALITVGTMALTPYLARDSVVWYLMRLHPKARRRGHKLSELKQHAIIIGYGQTGAKSLRVFQDAGVAVIVVDDDPAVIHALRQEGVACIEGDGSQSSVLQEANAEKARFILLTLRGRSNIDSLLQKLEQYPAAVLVRTFDPETKAMAESHHAVVVDAIMAGTEALEGWFALNCEQKISPNLPPLAERL